MSKISVIIDGMTFDVDVRLGQPGDSTALVEVNGQALSVSMPHLDGADQLAWALVDGRPYEVVVDRQLHWIKSAHGLHRLEVHDLETPTVRPASGDGRVKAPIPGLVTRLLISQGDKVEAGQPLLVLEAMKMENEIRAPFDGVVSSISATVGQSVVRNQVLVEIQ